MSNVLGLLVPKYAAPAEWNKDDVEVSDSLVVPRTGLYVTDQATLDTLVAYSVAATHPLVFLDTPPMGFSTDKRLSNPNAYYPTPALIAEMEQRAADLGASAVGNAAAAAASASAASTSAGNAATSAGNAATSASNAAVSAATAYSAAHWSANTTYSAGDIRLAPDGTVLKRNANGTSRPSFDATEQAAWTVQITAGGTEARAALDAMYAVRTLSGKRPVGINEQGIDVRDWGVIGDGNSHPLSASYGTLAAAQAVYPKAQALTDEQDWAAMQSLSYALQAAPTSRRRIYVPDGIRAYTTLPVDVLSFQRWQIDGEVYNAHAHNSPSLAMDHANVFRVGNMHPVIQNSANAAYWPTMDLNDVSAGQRSVTLTTPSQLAAAGVSLNPGDFVIVRNDTNGVAAGNGIIFDYQQINKVVAYDSGTGILTLSRPIKVSLSPAKLQVNKASLIDTTTSVDQPWWVADSVVIEGHGKLYGNTPFGYKMGAWKPRLSVRGEFQDALSSQAFIAGDLEIRDSIFSGRLLEVKFAAMDSKVRVRGDYVYDSTFPNPNTTISIGEQSTNIDVNVYMMRGPDYVSVGSTGTGSIPALDVWAQNITVRGEIHDYGTSSLPASFVAKVTCTGNVGRPPSDIDLTGLRLRTKTGPSKYVLVGDGSGAAVPTRVKTGANVRTIDGGAAPAYHTQVAKGTQIDALGAQGDSRRALFTSPGECPEHLPFQIDQITGPVTYAGSSETSLGTYNIGGIKSGDHITATLQVITAPTSGTFADLYATATANGTGSIKVSIRNRSATSVVFGTGTAFWVYISYDRRRL